MVAHNERGREIPLTRAEVINNLQDLERRVLASHVTTDGSDSVVIFHSELDALDEAIKQLDPDWPSKELK